jgi:hypothetical protein
MSPPRPLPQLVKTVISCRGGEWRLGVTGQEFKPSSHARISELGLVKDCYTHVPSVGFLYGTFKIGRPWDILLAPSRGCARLPGEPWVILLTKGRGSQESPPSIRP